MSLVGDVSGKTGGLFHDLGRTLMRQTEAVADACVEAARSAYHTLISSAENVTTVAVTFLQNVTTDVKNMFSKFLCCNLVNHRTSQVRPATQPTITITTH